MAIRVGLDGPRERDEAPQWQGVPRDRHVRASGMEPGWRWEQYDAKEMARWPEPPIGRRALREMCAPVTLVWKVSASGVGQPWVMVAESAMLRAVATGELGLYAWRAFEKEELIGRYAGTVIGTYGPHEHSRLEADYADVKARGAGDMVVELDVPGSKTKVQLVDAAGAGPPFLQRANDARNLRDGRGAVAKNSAIMSTDGELRSMKKARGEPGKGTAWGPVTVNGGWEELEKREISWGYGNAFWRDRMAGGRRPQQRTACQVDANATNERYAGTMWYEVGEADALWDRTEASTTADAMFVTEIRVEAYARRRGWAMEAMARETRRWQVREMHLISANDESHAAYSGMGFRTATAEQIDAGLTAAVPGDGERYMYIDTRALWAAAGARGLSTAAGHGRRLERREQCRLTRGDRWERAAVQAVRAEHRRQPGWRIQSVMPNKRLQVGHVFMIEMESGASDTRAAGGAAESAATAAETTRQASGADGAQSAVMSAATAAAKATGGEAAAAASEARTAAAGAAGHKDTVSSAGDGEHELRAWIEERKELFRELHAMKRARRAKNGGGEGGSGAGQGQDGDDGGGVADAEHVDASGQQEDDDAVDSDATTAARDSAEAHSARETATATARANTTWVVTANVAGMRMTMRQPDGRRLGGGWGDGLDLQARPTSKATRIIRELEDGGAVLGVLTDTHLSGDELEAMQGHLRGRGYDSEATEATEEQGTRNGRRVMSGGVLVVWKIGRWTKAGGHAAETVVPGRVVTVALRDLEDEQHGTLTVAGVYARCRGRRQQQGARTTARHRDGDNGDGAEGDRVVREVGCTACG